MSSKVDDEEYWTTSRRPVFSFDEEEPMLASSLFQSIRSTKRDTRPEPLFSSLAFPHEADVSQGVKPLESLVTKRSLAAILGEEKKGAETDKQSDWTVPPVSRTIRAITLGRPFSLHNYRSLELKSRLLDEAVKSKNGDAVLCVVLFLKKTLNYKLFFNLVQFQASALQPYINYLTTRFEARAAIELHLALGQAREAALKDFQFTIQPQQNLEKRLSKLRALLRDHFSTPDTEDRLQVENFLRFVEWQVANSGKRPELTTTVACALSYLLKNHWTDPRGQPLSPYMLSTMTGVSDRMFDWKAMTARAAAEDWNSISDLLLTKGWLGVKKLKTVISPDRIVVELHKLRAPEHVVSDFFALIDTTEYQLDLAKKLSWHRAVIDTLVSMKDRQGLLLYQATLIPQSSDFLHAESALRTNAKWKN